MLPCWSPFPFPYLPSSSIIEFLPLHSLVFLCDFSASSGCLSSPQITATPGKPTAQTQRKQSQDCTICTYELESYLITLLLTLVGAATGSALHTFAGVFSASASVFTEELSDVEIPVATLIGGGGGRVCILGVLAEPASAA